MYIAKKSSRTDLFRLPLLLGALLLSAACPNAGVKNGGDTIGNTNQPVTPGTGQNANQPNATAQQPNGPAIVFRGRFDTVTDANVSTMAWPGAEILFGFQGTKLTVTLGVTDTASYNGAAQSLYMGYAIDGGNAQTIKLQSGKSDYALAQNLAAGQHTVRLIHLNEGQWGRVMYYGVTTDGNMTFTPPASGRRLEFVGDSGACGYGALGAPDSAFSTATESADVAFPALVGRALNAESRNISYSGKGLIQNRDTKNDAVKTMPVLWERTLPLDDPYLLWDFNQYKPQAVIAIISGNDVYVSVPTQDMFNQKIGAFIKSLRQVYPQALLLFGASPMLRSNDPHTGQRTTALGYLKNTIAAANDPNVQFIDLPQDNGFFGANCGGNCFLDPETAPTCLGQCVGSDAHMIPSTHELVANSIVTVLKAKLNW